jgi:Ca-activated chloride channel family protein
MHFLAPAYLWLLVAVGALAAAYVAVQLRRKVYAARFSNVELLGSVAPRRPGWRRHLTFALLLIALLVLSVGVAKPASAVRVPRDNATVILAVDVSLSMEATDVLPTRIGAAKAAGKQFVNLLPKRINLGIVSFGGNANLLVPPTLNRQAARNAITGMHLETRTAIGEAIFTSLAAIRNFTRSDGTPAGKQPPARIVLLSDGTNTWGRSVNSAIAAARRAHVQVSTIAFGTPNGTVTIMGRTQLVPADDATLSEIAQRTGGSFHTAHSEQELRSVYADIGSQIGYVTHQRDISWRFLLGGLLALFAAGAVSLLWSGRLS